MFKIRDCSEERKLGIVCVYGSMGRLMIAEIRVGFPRRGEPVGIVKVFVNTIFRTASAARFLLRKLRFGFRRYAAAGGSELLLKFLYLATEPALGISLIVEIIFDGAAEGIVFGGEFFNSLPVAFALSGCTFNLGFHGLKCFLQFGYSLVLAFLHFFKFLKAALNLVHNGEILVCLFEFLTGFGCFRTEVVDHGVGHFNLHLELLAQCSLPLYLFFKSLNFFGAVGLRFGLGLRGKSPDACGLFGNRCLQLLNFRFLSLYLPAQYGTVRPLTPGKNPLFFILEGRHLLLEIVYTVA